MQAGAFKITKFTNPSGETVHRLSGWDKGGNRVRRNFQTYDEAWAEEQRFEAEVMNVKKLPLVETRLTSQQIAEAETAFRILNGRSLLLAVEFFADHYTEPLQKMTAAKAYGEFIRAKETEKKLRPRALKNLQSRVGTFIGRQPHQRHVHEIPEADVQAYVFKSGISARTATNNLYALNNFFRFCLKRRWTQTNPLANAERPKTNDATPQILSVEKIRLLLDRAALYKSGRLVPYLTLATFAAIRPAEIERLSWESIDLRQRHVVIEGEFAKKRKRRIVELSKNAVEWLRPFAEEKTPLVGKNWRRDFERVRLLAGFGNATEKHPDLKPWPDDVLRHSGITHKLNDTGSDEKTSLWAGNKPSTIHTYYKGLAAKAESKRFWSISPSDVKAKILTLPKAA